MKMILKNKPENAKPYRFVVQLNQKVLLVKSHID